MAGPTTLTRSLNERQRGGLYTVGRRGCPHRAVPAGGRGASRVVRHGPRTGLRDRRAAAEGRAHPLRAPHPRPLVPRDLLGHDRGPRRRDADRDRPAGRDAWVPAPRAAPLLLPILDGGRALRFTAEGTQSISMIGLALI